MVTTADIDDTIKTRPITDLFERLVAEALEHGVDDARINAALDSATQAAAERVADRLRVRAPRMLREHKRYRKGFERRLERRWRRALDLYVCVQTCCFEAGKDYYKRCLGQAEPEQGAKFSALTLIHARACLVASEVQGLLRTGHAAGAQARWRTLHELAVVAFLLGQSDDVIAVRFLDHQHVERLADAKCYQEYCQALGYEQFSQADMAILQQRHDEVVARYGPIFKTDWGWAKPLFPNDKDAPGFGKLEGEAKLTHNRPWVRLSSHGIHGGITGTLHIQDFYGYGKMMLAGPSNVGLADPANGALTSLYQVTVAFLLYGSPDSPTAEDLVSLRAIAMLLDQATRSFLEIHHAQQAEEAAKAPAEVVEAQADERATADTVGAMDML